MIQLTDFSKTYRTGLEQKEITAVDSISFTAETDTITGLLGLNGAGKTTIIRSICALQYASSGRILIEDRNGHAVNPAEDPVLAKSIVGYVPEQPLVYRDFTVAEFLHAAASIRGMDKKTERNAFDRVADLFSLESVLNKKIHTLSKGFRQRVSFAQALLHDPPVLILDEPTSGLDPAQTFSVKQLLKKLSAKRTILFSTHVLQEASELCSKVCIITAGRLAESGPVQDICRRQKTDSFEKAFIMLAGADTQ